jgi:HEPN domain-containing protein
MKPAKAEAHRWIAQARSDLAFTELGVREGYYAQACFMCQQAAEKALKALRYHAGDRVVLGHSVVELRDSLRDRHPALAGLREAAQQLDQYYVPTRYPNGLPGGVPAEVFSKAQATGALALGRQFLALAEGVIG